MTACIADGGDVNALAQFPKLALGAPEAAHAEQRCLRAGWIWPLERSVKNEMLARGRDWRRAAWQRLGRRWHFKLFLEHQHGDVSAGPGLNIVAAPACCHRNHFSSRCSRARITRAVASIPRKGRFHPRRETPM